MKTIFLNIHVKNVAFEWDRIFKTNSCEVGISAETCIYSTLDNVKMWSDEATHLNTDLTVLFKFCGPSEWQTKQCTVSA